MRKFAKRAAGISIGLAGAALAFLSDPGTAQAATITYVYNCAFSAVTTCNAGGPFGTITLTDSVVDPNRVDISVVLNGANILAQNSSYTGLDNFFLNYNQAAIANTGFTMVDVGAAVGTHTNDAGDATLNPDNTGPYGNSSDFDMLLNPAGSASSSTFTGSLVLYDTKDAAHAEHNLDVGMFSLLDMNGQFYSAFTTLPSNNTFRGGSTMVQEQTSVPEPATMGIFLTGMAGLGAMGLARRKRKKA